MPAPPTRNLAPLLHDGLAQIDRRTAGRLKKGKLKPEARLDLHGMTQDRAHPALNRFILDAHMTGLKLVLVITGKGKVRDADGPMPVPVGVLRHNVPHWLNSGPLKAVVHRTSQAHLRHGGDGAYYVWLRRAR